MGLKERKALGERLAIVRASAGLSQKEMGEKLAISWRSYQNYELGSRDPSAEVLLKVCEIFGYRLAWLVRNEGGPKNNFDRKSLKAVLVKIEKSASDSTVNLTAEAKAEVTSRLIGKLADGHEVTPQEIKDYIEIAGGSYE